VRVRLSVYKLALVALASVGPFAIVHGQGNQAGQISAAEFDRLFTQVSNWGRWGKDDQRGAMNLITADKRREAAALVKDGVSVSLQFAPLEGAAPERGNPGYSSVNALCALTYNGRMYNGFAQEPNANPRCASTLGLSNLKDGIFTRGVLIDMPDVKGVASLERGTAVTLQDLEEWERKTGIKVTPGDAVFLRTGSWARRPKPGSGEGFTQHLLREAGYHWSVVPWLKSHDVAIIGSDTLLDVRLRDAKGEITILDVPVRALAVAAMGVHVLDGQNLEGLAQLAKKLNRWEFLLTASPITVTAQSIPVNVIATF
jgi:kynurenine formamidase